MTELKKKERNFLTASATYHMPAGTAVEGHLHEVVVFGIAFEHNVSEKRAKEILGKSDAGWYHQDSMKALVN